MDPSLDFMANAQSEDPDQMEGSITRDVSESWCSPCDDPIRYMEEDQRALYLNSFMYYPAEKGNSERDSRPPDR